MEVERGLGVCSSQEVVEHLELDPSGGDGGGWPARSAPTRLRSPDNCIRLILLLLLLFPTLFKTSPSPHALARPISAGVTTAIFLEGSSSSSAAAAMAGAFSALRRVYLSLYNWAVFLGWVQVLYFALKTLRESSYREVYGAVERPLQLAQTAAVMEILHGLVGLVRSPVSATLPQIGSRLYVTWGILWSFPEVREHVLVSSLVISWSITEIIRYSFFGMKETFGAAPSWHLWLRYSTFLLLYPTGITSEVGLIYTALPFIKASEKYCIRMPNKWNFSFDYFYAAVVALGIYVPGSPHMYQYMLGQRKKALSKAKTA